MADTYYGYCFPKVDGWHTPRVELHGAEAAYRYCAMHHRLFEEIRITDTMDFCVLHVVNHVLKVPMPDGSFREMTLR